MRHGENAVPSADGQGAPCGGFLVEDHVGFLLRRAHQRHVALFLEIAGKHGLTPTQFAALFKAVELGKVTQNLLGRLTAMDPATVQGVVRRLTARGLLCRTHDPMDRRTAVLAPTEAGIALIDRAVACARRSHDAALAPLNAPEQTQLLALLRKLA
jgi:DNA-binding MarR family transcriptional regulator